MVAGEGLLLVSGGKKMVRVFFSKTKKSAVTRARSLGFTGRVVLARLQIPHIAGWKTWELKKRLVKRRKRR